MIKIKRLGSRDFDESASNLIIIPLQEAKVSKI
jgi:hypothetical protein